MTLHSLQPLLVLCGTPPEFVNDGFASGENIIQNLARQCFRAFSSSYSACFILETNFESYQMGSFLPDDLEFQIFGLRRNPLWLFTASLGGADHERFKVPSDILDTSSLLIKILSFTSIVKETKLQIFLPQKVGTNINTWSIDHITFIDGSRYLCRLIDVNY